MCITDKGGPGDCRLWLLLPGGLQPAGDINNPSGIHSILSNNKYLKSWYSNLVNPLGPKPKLPHPTPPPPPGFVRHF